MPAARSFHYPPLDAASLRAGCCLTSIGTLGYASRQPYPQSGHPKDFEFQWVRGRKLPDFALVLILSGRGEWEAVRGRRQKVIAGDAFFLVPGGWHRYRPDSATGWTESWLCVQGPSVHSLASSGLLPAHCLHLRGAVPRGVPEKLDRLRREVSAKSGTNLPSWGLRALTLILDCFEPSTPMSRPASPAASAADTALQFIRDHAHRPIGVRDVATGCGLERRTLERRFRRAGLPSVGRSIILERIHRSEMLLAETGMQVKEVAYACGFGSPQRMIYDFRRVRGTTPGRLRSRKTV